jgi:hypothetical protein
MEIPKNNVSISLLRQYGPVSELDLDEHEEMYGCPYRYKKFILERMERPFSFPLEYGTMIHAALAKAEETEIPLLPDCLEDVWDAQLPAEAYDEAVQDLTCFLDRGGLNLSMIAVEKDLSTYLVTINGKKYRFRGRLDWIGFNTEETNTLYFADYKTNRSPTSQAELDRNIQMAGYGMLLKENLDLIAPGMFDKETVKIVGILEQLKWNTLYTHIDQGRMDLFVSWARAITKAILSDDEAKPRLNKYCGHCPLKFDCEVFTDLSTDGKTLIDAYTSTRSLSERVELMQKAQTIKSGLESIVKEVREELLNNGGGIFGDIEYFISQKWEKTYDLVALHKALGLDFYSIIKVVEKTLDAYGKKNLDKVNDIEASRDKVPTKSTLKQKRI